MNDTKRDDIRAPYETPQAMRLGAILEGTGTCWFPGSGDADQCYMNGTSAGATQGCYYTGTSAIDTCDTGSGVTV